MDYQMKRESLLIRLKNILNENKVKLWLSPHYEENTSNMESLQELASNYRQTLNTDEETCLEMLQELQNLSLSRLEERDNYRSSGLATLRIRVSGKQIPEFSVQIKLDNTVNDLKQLTADKIEISLLRVKLIAGGRVLQCERTLYDQDVKNGSIVLAIVLASDVEKDLLKETKNNQILLEETKNDVELLMNRDTRANLNLMNQSGVSLNLPPEEKKALILAIALHERGRKAFKRGKYSLALVFFLEADSEFKFCCSDILKKVDNYAVLNLDIVWTYLHLKSLHCLSDAEDRLKKCEEAFLHTYGQNLERLKNIKGTTGNESVLLVRLHLLQGILYYYLNRRSEMMKKFSDVEDRIKLLKVDNANVETLCDLGYSPKEARIALRATFNDLEAAVTFIHDQREERERVKQHEKIRRFADKHKCLNGDLINLTVLEQLFNMGYTRLLGVYALMNSNNRISDALIWIENFLTNLYNNYPSHVVDQMKNLEFDDPNVHSVLKYHKFELNDLSTRHLLAINSEELLSDVLNSLPNFDFGCVASTSGGLDLTKKSSEALNRLQKSIINDKDDYLDIDLESEENFLLQFKALV